MLLKCSNSAAPDSRLIMVLIKTWTLFSGKPIRLFVMGRSTFSATSRPPTLSNRKTIREAKIKTDKIDGVVLMSADRHRSDLRKIPREGSYSLYDMMRDFVCMMSFVKIF